MHLIPMIGRLEMRIVMMTSHMCKSKSEVPWFCSVRDCSLPVCQHPLLLGVGHAVDGVGRVVDDWCAQDADVWLHISHHLCMIEPHYGR